MDERIYCVYKHTCPNDKVYIGITKQNPKHRWNYGKGYKHNKHFNNAIIKYGWDNIKHEILLKKLTLEEAYNWEKVLISYYDSSNPEFGYNKSIGGENINNLNSFEENVLPTYSEIKNNEYLLSIFNKLIECAKGFDYEEKIETYYGSCKTTKIIKRHFKPSNRAINVIIHNYNDEEELKDLIEELKLKKIQIEKDDW